MEQPLNYTFLGIGLRILIAFGASLLVSYGVGSFLRWPACVSLFLGCVLAALCNFWIVYKAFLRMESLEKYATCSIKRATKKRRIR